MQWNDPAEIEGCITRLREDQHAQQHQLEDAVSIELRSEAAADSARAVQCRCRTAIRDDADEIDRLLGETARPAPTATQGAGPVTRRISCALDLCLWPLLTTGACVIACVDDRLLRWLRDVPVDDEPDVIG